MSSYHAAPRQSAAEALPNKLNSMMCFFFCCSLAGENSQTHPSDRAENGAVSTRRFRVVLCYEPNSPDLTEKKGNNGHNTLQPNNFILNCRRGAACWQCNTGQFGCLAAENMKN